MPIYDYKCPACSERLKHDYRFSKIREIKNRDAAAFCPHCGTRGEFVTAPRPDVKTRKVRNPFQKV